MRLLLALAFLLMTPAMATCGDGSVLTEAFRFGLSIQSWMPNDLPDFSKNAMAYGLHVGVPVGPGSVQVGGAYATGDSLSSYIGEVNYRLRLPTPFLTPYVQGGGHYLHYRGNGQDHQGVGGNAGFGFMAILAKDFEIALGLQGYLRERALLAMGGGFSFRL